MPTGAAAAPPKGTPTEGGREAEAEAAGPTGAPTGRAEAVAEAESVARAEGEAEALLLCTADAVLALLPVPVPVPVVSMALEEAVAGVEASRVPEVEAGGDLDTEGEAEMEDVREVEGLVLGEPERRALALVLLLAAALPEGRGGARGGALALGLGLRVTRGLLGVGEELAVAVEALLGLAEGKADWLRVLEALVVGEAEEEAVLLLLPPPPPPPPLLAKEAVAAAVTEGEEEALVEGLQESVPPRRPAGDGVAEDVALPPAAAPEVREPEGEALGVAAAAWVRVPETLPLRVLQALPVASRVTERAGVRDGTSEAVPEGSTPLARGEGEEEALERAEALKEGEALLEGVALAERERRAGEGLAVLLVWVEALGEGLLAVLWEGEGVRLGEAVPLPVSVLPPPPPPLPGEAEAVWLAPLPLALPVGLGTGLALPWLAVALALPLSTSGGLAEGSAVAEGLQLAAVLCEAAAPVSVGEGEASTDVCEAALALAQEE